MSQFFYFSRGYDTIHKFLNKMFKNFVDSFGSWCIIASLMTSVIRCTGNVSQIRLRFPDYQ